MSCFKLCLLLVIALTLLMESVSCSPVYVWEDTDDTGSPDTLDTITAITDKTDGGDAPVLLQRLRRHLAQMYVGNHHYNYQTDTGKTGSRRRHNRRQNGVIVAQA